MLSQNGDEGAFLTASRSAPRVGERLELSDPGDADQTIPQQSPGCSLGLPRFGRVVRLDRVEGSTQRVAIRFEKPENQVHSAAIE